MRVSTHRCMLCFINTRAHTHDVHRFLTRSKRVSCLQRMRLNDSCYRIYRPKWAHFERYLLLMRLEFCDCTSNLPRKWLSLYQNWIFLPNATQFYIGRGQNCMTVTMSEQISIRLSSGRCTHKSYCGFQLCGYQMYTQSRSQSHIIAVGQSLVQFILTFGIRF